MADILSILVKAEIDLGQQSISSINTQIAELEKKISSIKIKINIDDSQFKEINKKINEFNSKTKKSSNISLDSDFKKLAMLELQMIDKIEEKRIQTIERRRKLERDEIEKDARFSNKAAEDKYKSEQDLIEKMENMRLKTIEKRQKEEQALGDAQDKAINKNLENQYKLEQQEERRIANLGTRLKEVKDIDWTNNESIREWATSLERSDRIIESFQVKGDALKGKMAEITLVTNDGTNHIKKQKMVLDQNTTSLYQQSEALKPNINRMLGFTEQLKIAIQRSVTWGLAMGALYGSLRKIREGVSFISDLDKDMTQIKVITGMTSEQTKELAKSYAELGYEVGKTVKEISSASVELYRQGLAVEEVDKRMRVITQMAAVGDIDVGETTKVITSSVNALGEEAEKTADILLKAGAISASSAEEIGAALTKTASSAKATGMTIEETTSYLATLIETTQESPESLGNSLKTLLARFTKVNEETGELNESLNDVQTAFESVGIAFTDSEGQIRPISNLLDELSVKWKSLDKNTQFYLATQAAGKVMPDNTVMYYRNSTISGKPLTFMQVA